jgi:hypothetical protein
MTAHYRPSDAEADNFERRLRALLLEAVLRVRDQGEPLLALALAEQLEQGRYRLMTRLDIGEDGQPDIGSLWFVVEVEWFGAWVELVEARWPVFGISEESAREEARWTALQNGLGLPDDLSELDSPS